MIKRKRNSKRELDRWFARESNDPRRIRIEGVFAEIKLQCPDHPVKTLGGASGVEVSIFFDEGLDASREGFIWAPILTIVREAGDFEGFGKGRAGVEMDGGAFDLEVLDVGILELLATGAERSEHGAVPDNREVRGHFRALSGGL
jgi:hypothetical protein